MRPPSEAPLYSCPTDSCRVATFVAKTSLAKCPGCETAGILIRYPIVVDVGGTARIRAALAAAAVARPVYEGKA